jgi:hypothetical protein
MKGEELLLSFISHGIKLRLKGDTIEVSPRSLITEKMREYIRNNKLFLLAALQNRHATQIIACNDCIHFTPDKIGDGAGIGSCSCDINWTQEINGRSPLFRYTKRHCNDFNSST